MDAVLGWLRLKPGKREAFMSQVPRYLAATRSMDGVLFAEINPSHEDADLVVLTFGYRDATAHRALADAPQELELLSILDELAIDGRFENITSRGSRLDVVRFPIVG